MYAGMFNNHEKATWQMCHGNEHKFGDLLGLPAQNDFPSILPKH